jgi:hypothetical protein
MHQVEATRGTRMELKKAYELESLLKVTLVVRDEQISEAEEEEEEQSDNHRSIAKADRRKV